MTTSGDGQVEQAFSNVLDCCLGVRAGEQIVLLTDEASDGEVVARLLEVIRRREAVGLVACMPVPAMPGAEPPAAVASFMRAADAVVELTSTFIGSSEARRNASAVGVRYLAMPGVRLETFRDDGPLAIDFDALRGDAERVGEAWRTARSFHLTSVGGTDLVGSVIDRPGRVLHGIARDPGAYMAPPDVESGTAPVEGTTSGTVVVDADLLFMGVGPLAEPVVLQFEKGCLADISGPESGRLTSMLERCHDERMVNLAEVSMAFNPSGRVCSVAMETESVRGSAHIALGNSIAYGGTVAAVAHLDCVMSDATLELDGKVVMSSGTLW